MIKDEEISERIINNILELDKFQKKVFDSNSTEQIITVVKEVLQTFTDRKPAEINLGDGTTRTDRKGKLLMLEVLKNDLLALENNQYSDLKNQKFAITSSLALLMGVFSHLSTMEILNILEKKASR